MLLDNKHKVVELFVENFLAGSINVDFLKLIQHSKNINRELDSLNTINADIVIWYNLHTIGDKIQLEKKTQFLFDLFINGRSLGLITGILKEIPELEKELEECHQNNILLAQDGKEKERIIATYEARMFEKK